MVITYPLMTVVDDSGAIVAGATVTIASVKDKAGADVANHGATLNTSGANVSVDYDAEARGEAWLVMSISKAGSTFTGLNASPAFYLADDSGDIARTLAAVLGTGTAVKVNDAGATANSFTVSGAPSDAQAGDYTGAVAIVLTGTGAANSAPVTASTAAPVRLTLGSGLQSPPDDGAIIWLLDIT